MLQWVCNLTRVGCGKSVLCRSITLSSEMGLPIEGAIISDFWTETSGMNESNTSSGISTHGSVRIRNYNILESPVGPAIYDSGSSVLSEVKVFLEEVAADSRLCRYTRVWSGPFPRCQCWWADLKSRAFCFYLSKKSYFFLFSFFWC